MSGAYHRAASFDDGVLEPYRQHALKNWVRMARVERYEGLQVGQSIRVVTATSVMACEVTGFAEVTRGVANTELLLQT